MDTPRKFAITPDLNAIERIDRLVAFHPARNQTPGTLTAAQIAQYNADGYLRGFRIFSESEISEIRAGFDLLLEKVTRAGGDSYSISSAHLSYPEAYEILTDSRIVDYVSDLLGDDVIGWGSHYFCKMPHDGKQVAWHQDASYWPLTPTKTVTVWLAVDDADSENACMRFIPGSHLRGHIDFEATDDDSSVLNQTIADVDRFGEPVDDELKAGEISLHADLLLHGSEANDSDRRRCGLTLRYCAAGVRAHLDWNLKGVVVAGEDRDGHWANPARPA